MTGEKKYRGIYEVKDAKTWLPRKNCNYWLKKVLKIIRNLYGMSLTERLDTKQKRGMAKDGN